MTKGCVCGSLWVCLWVWGVGSNSGTLVLGAADCQITEDYCIFQLHSVSSLSWFRCVEMQRISSRLIEQFGERWATLLNRLRDDPKIAQLMSTRIGEYLRSHPFVALTLLLFSAMAALPVGVFLTFAIVTIVMSAVGFVFFEVLLLFVGGLALLSVLGGIAFFAVLASVVINAFFITIPSLLRQKYPHLTKRGVNHEKASEGETSGSKEM